MNKKLDTAEFRIEQTDDGLHLQGSILWFDAQGQTDLSFLSSAHSPFNPKSSQLITTEETAKILEAYRRKPNALVCQYNRPFSIGRLKMELLPSGCILGGASLYLETDSNRLLYAPELQPNRIPTVRQMQLKRASTLVMGTTHPDPFAPVPNRKKEKERLLETVHQMGKLGQFPIVFCDPLSMAQELTKLLTDNGFPVAVHESIFKAHQVYESFGSKLGDYTRYARRSNREKIVLFPLPRKKTSVLPIVPPDTPLIAVEADPDAGSSVLTAQHLARRFIISSSCDGADLKEIVTAVSPKDLYIFGPHTKRYVEGLSGLGVNVRPLYLNDQPTLF